MASSWKGYDVICSNEGFYSLGSQNGFQLEGLRLFYPVLPYTLLVAEWLPAGRVTTHTLLQQLHLIMSQNGFQLEGLRLWAY